MPPKGKPFQEGMRVRVLPSAYTRRMQIDGYEGVVVVRPRRLNKESIVAVRLDATLGTPEGAKDQKQLGHVDGMVYLMKHELMELGNA